MDFWDNDSATSHRLVVGSYGRGTAIAISDIDVVVELPWSEYSRFNNYAENGQAALLQLLPVHLRVELKAYNQKRGKTTE